MSGTSLPRSDRRTELIVAGTAIALAAAFRIALPATVLGVWRRDAVAPAPWHKIGWPEPGGRHRG